MLACAAYAVDYSNAHPLRVTLQDVVSALLAAHGFRKMILLKNHLLVLCVFLVSNAQNLHAALCDRCCLVCGFGAADGGLD